MASFSNVKESLPNNLAPYLQLGAFYYEIELINKKIQNSDL
ncbi:hypothetical protein VQL36_03490 [Chengkuizengella sp. SCS-71B]